MSNYQFKNLAISFNNKLILNNVFKKFFLDLKSILHAVDFSFESRIWPADRSLPIPALDVTCTASGLNKTL